MCVRETKGEKEIEGEIERKNALVRERGSEAV